MKIQQQVGWGTADSDVYIGPERQLTVDSERHELRLHDGTTPGGHRILNESQMAAYGSLLFTGVTTLGLVASQNLDATHVRKLVNVSAVAGPWNLRLPPLADFDIGESILIRAAGADVVLIPVDGEGWINGTSEEVNFSHPLPDKQLITLAKFSATRFIVTSIR